MTMTSSWVVIDVILVIHIILDVGQVVMVEAGVHDDIPLVRDVDGAGIARPHHVLGLK